MADPDIYRSREAMLGKWLKTNEPHEDERNPKFQDQVYGRARDTGWASGNRWLVLVFPNQSVQSAISMNWIVDTARLATTCKSVTLNEQTWYTTEQNQINAGPSRIFPYKRNSNNASGIKIQFNCGADMFEKQFFEEWLRYIQDPKSRQWRYYDEYTTGSEIFVLLLPNHVSNFYMAMEDMQKRKIIGYRLTEVYPLSLNINGGSLNYDASNSPLFCDIGFMYHDIVPLIDPIFSGSDENQLPTVTDTGFPVIAKNRYSHIFKENSGNIDRAIDGFTIGLKDSQKAFQEVKQKQRTILDVYAKQLSEFKNENFPRAVDGRVVYSTPRQGGLQLGLTLLSQTQGFFGAGFFGNGFNP